MNEHPKKLKKFPKITFDRLHHASNIEKIQLIAAEHEYFKKNHIWRLCA